ncbi:MAG: hypothetical protein A3D24_01535 [Candidatus Blackburnbacteria bacterium RIFCSPHIGHO2_02_FULL_39_13]|uniref:histidine kinase n=1 Tax=Candidatus Blackburnbacteria bacterium RIFCSPLOWO2_01_FULL_40_20 TaxID=1797519 RepID=A0A1G1VCX3_9BACT|nr:MAG: PAS/PAC sensor hybrid histidine kinase [Microgenomates group bacterium GW2011_GWA2_39_19]OGY06983.1 MAG: hypothetical protein A2694_02610 [Candidatus Blackburnbacteria bacterium RIFCSPHIGHO2_01_FULL_40_17]OGY08725.1 MAG: hypothetical protein A3D24_01535 [Candidatus Blackburnbacteria bacterium RIFCSPHIGHO2_02_FULL_39_13]OGY13239.1 MAG: hypothetical protein A3A77_01560 [Candidatus Blackburnbacteria bacterium RIFCSPLOWO2_01_FULL_40_20]HBL52397.1 hypothetical protein [Candidatus Blackburnba
MAESNVSSKAEEVGVNVGEKRDRLVVHIVRVLVKLGIVLTLVLSNSPNYLVLSIYLVVTEVLDQFSIYFSRLNPKFKRWIGYFYALNSVAVISAIAYFAQWTLNDFYLVYLVHISSSTLAYGFSNGLLSFILSVFTYSSLLFANNAPFYIYVRLPLMSILVLRLLMNQQWYEKIRDTLAYMMDVERSKQDFIGLASHNLRTPVAAIYGYIDLLLRGDVGQLTHEQTSFLEKIKGNNQELEKMTEQLLQISILEVNHEVNLMKQPTQIETIIEDAVVRYEPQAKSKSITLTFQKSTIPLPLTYIDVEKVKSVILNLIDNAIKYTEKGGVTVSANLVNDNIIVGIKDTGVGISPEDLPKVFNKFFRSGSILVYNQTGVGLGLYLGKKIIELHKGTVTVESVLNQGSTFTISLPVGKEDVLE